MPPLTQTIAAVFLDLPDTRTSQRNSVSWKPGRAPGTGLLSVYMQRMTAAYGVREFGTRHPGRCFHLDKLGTQTADYDVYLGSNGQDFQCSCPAFTYGHGKPCKHVHACRALIEAELVNPDVDVRNTEVEDQDEPSAEEIERIGAMEPTGTTDLF